MIADYLNDACADCPLIRLYQGSPQNYADLIAAFENLLKAQKEEFDIFSLEEVSAGTGIRSLLFRMEENDQGVIQFEEAKFICICSKETISDMVNKLLMFKNENLKGYYWLDDHFESEIALLLSPDGRW